MKKLLKILTIVLFITSCEPNKEYVDLSGIELETKIDRFEIDLAIETNEASIKNLAQKYPSFFRIFARNIIGAGDMEPGSLAYYINSFTNDANIKEVHEACLKEFSDLSNLENEFNDAFKHYLYYFPDKFAPRIISFMSGFNYTIMVDDSLLAFGLDMYLGSDSKYYPRLGIPKYRFQSMSRENIVSDCMKGWITTEYELKSEESTLLSQMIYHGKLLYAMDLILPDVEDHLKIGYTEEELNWCNEHEADIWFHFVDKELLYQQDNNTITKYMNEAPFTPGFPEGSPGEAGKWIGWKIVRKFMEKHPEINLQQLFEKELEAQDILTTSQYKPKR